jgi:hypothetical protein
VNGRVDLTTHDLVIDEVLRAWDLTMTKVQVGSGLWGEYLFYKIQLIHDKGRDVYILYTRWGRIGEVGASQRTPFPTVNIYFKQIVRGRSKGI